MTHRSTTEHILPNMQRVGRVRQNHEQKPVLINTELIRDQSNNMKHCLDRNVPR